MADSVFLCVVDTDLCPVRRLFGELGGFGTVSVIDLEILGKIIVVFCVLVCLCLFQVIV